MTIFEIIESYLPFFSKTDLKIYEGIQRFPEHFANDSITKISLDSGVSKSALSRFAQKLGFSGYTEFQFQLNNDRNNHKGNSDDTVSLSGAISNLLNQVEQMIAPETLDKVIEQLRQARGIYILGYHTSRLVAEELTLTLSHYTDFVVCNPSVDSLPSNCKSDDLVIIYSSLTGQAYKEFLMNLKKRPEKRPHLILITTNPKFPLRQHFDDIVIIPSPSVSILEWTNTAVAEIFAYIFFNELLAQRINHLKQQ